MQEGTINTAKSRQVLFYALAGWFVLNLLQAVFTELFHDEAYYWVYSRNLTFTYFDQMPAVACWIRAGEFLIPGEAGVRLLTVLASAPVIYGIYRLSEIENPRWFFFFVFSTMIVHVGGFLTAPDSVLGLAIVLFLFAYRRWLRTPGLKAALLLALAGAFVCYSKYQGIPFIIITFLLNIRKWNKLVFWLPPVLTVLLASPIYFNDPETVRQTLAFHLAGRNGGQTPLQLYSNFFSSQFAVLGPFILPYLVIAVVRFRSEDFFFASLRYAVIIYYCLLLIISFHSNVEGNWCGPAVPGMIILSIRYWTGRPRAWRFARYVFGSSAVVLLLARVYLVWDFLPADLSRKLYPEYHGWDRWAQQVKDICGDERVVISNSYQLTSKYWFYSGSPATCASNSRYRKNQFSVMPMEQEWQGQPVWFAYPYQRAAGMDSVTDPWGRTLFFERYDRFYSYYDVEIRLVSLPAILPTGDTSLLEFEIAPAGDSGKALIAEKEGIITIGYWWLNEREQYSSFDDTTNYHGTVLPATGIRRFIPIITPTEPGEYLFCTYFLVDHRGFSMNSVPVKIKVQ